MKTWVWGALIIAIVVSFVGAQNIPQSQSVAAYRVTAVGGACATTDTALSHDELLEGWQGASEENTWATTGDGSGITLDDDNLDDLTSGAPAGACTEHFKVTVVADGTTAKYETWDRGSEIAETVTTEFVCYVWVVTQPDNSEAFNIVTCGENNTPTAAWPFYLSLQATSGGVCKLLARGTTSSSIVGTDGTITTGAWHKAAIHLEDTDANATLTIDDGTPLGFTSAAYGIRYVHAGATGSLAAGDSGTFYLDVLALNTP